MTVAEFIERLRALPRDAQVLSTGRRRAPDGVEVPWLYSLRPARLGPTITLEGAGVVAVVVTTEDP